MPTLLRRSAGQLRRLGDDDVFVAEAKDAFHIAPLDRGKGVAVDFDRLLRHRLLLKTGRVARLGGSETAESCVPRVHGYVSGSQLLQFLPQQPEGVRARLAVDVDRSEREEFGEFRKAASSHIHVVVKRG